MRISDWSSDVCSADLLEPDREEQQDDPQLAEQRDVLGRRDRDMFQPRKIRGERAEPRRADEQPDEDEADHGREAEAREGGDYNARRAEHHQRSEENTSELKSLMRNTYVVF